MKRLRARLALCTGMLATALGCSVGEGDGRISSERLHIQDCWTGPLDLVPDFFGADPYREESLQIRIQLGDNSEEQSDGMIVLINDLQTVRSLGEAPIPVGLPAGVAPPGTAPQTPPDQKPNSPKVSLSLYLHDTCHGLNATLHALSGQVVFHSLFSGDPNEDRADQRLTDAEFDAVFADPREVIEAEGDGASVKSRVTGYFRFYFQRGQPAQPFQ